LPEIKSPSPWGSEVLARIPDGSTNLPVNYKNATDISLFSELPWARLKRSDKKKMMMLSFLKSQKEI
jgi:hypothetical protein